MGAEDAEGAEEEAIYSYCRLLGAGAEVLEDGMGQLLQVRLRVVGDVMMARDHPYGGGLRVLLPGRLDSLLKMIVWTTTKRTRLLDLLDLDLGQ